MRIISSWAIKNPIAPVVLFIMLTILGIGSFFKLPINSNPDIDFPAFTVDVSMPGAAPSDIQNQITVKIEGALAGIEGVKKITSTAQTSHSNTFVELQIGADFAEAVDDARAAVSQVRSDLPSGIMEPIVQRIDFNDQDPIGIYAIKAPKMADEDLSWFIDNDVTREFLAVRGVARVTRFGGVSRQITVDIDQSVRWTKRRLPDRLLVWDTSKNEPAESIVTKVLDKDGFTLGEKTFYREETQASLSE